MGDGYGDSMQKKKNNGRVPALASPLGSLRHRTRGLSAGRVAAAPEVGAAHPVTSGGSITEPASRAQASVIRIGRMTGEE